jgi:hypothetical protein
VKRTQIKPSEDELLTLLEHESNWQLMNASSLTTMTGKWNIIHEKISPHFHPLVFEEASPGSFNLNSLYDRVALMTKKNPWLTGRLRLMPQGVQLYYSKNFINCFQSIPSTTKFQNELSYDQLITLVKPYSVSMGRECIGTNKPLFLVTVLQYKSPQTHRKQIILIFSLSPILGDIHTFYQLYEMLDPEIEVRTMNAQRLDEYSSHVKHFIGRREYNWFHYSMVSKWNPTILKFLSPKPQVFAMYFDSEEWIPMQKDHYQQQRQQQQEQEHSGGGGGGGGVDPLLSLSSLSFLSTNDLLTSWFFSLCHCDYGFMSINFRNRIQRLDDHFAGNYSERILYRPLDYGHPALIRLSLAAYRRCGHRLLAPAANVPSSSSSSSRRFFSLVPSFASSLPSLWTALQNNSCECNNWCQPYRNICLSGVMQLLHLPIIVDYEENLAVKETLLLFRPTYGTVGGILISHSQKIQMRFNELMNQFELNQWRNTNNNCQQSGQGNGNRSERGGGRSNNQSQDREGQGHQEQQQEQEQCGAHLGKVWLDLSEAEMLNPIRNMILRGRSKNHVPLLPTATTGGPAAEGSTSNASQE